MPGNQYQNSPVTIHGTNTTNGPVTNLTGPNLPPPYPVATRPEEGPGGA